MKYLVVTPLAREEFQDVEKAVDRAKDMILEAIVNCRPTPYWWARIVCLTSGMSGLITCPHVGFWRYNGAELFNIYL